MKRVLLPIDGSECSLRAVNLVIAKRLLYAQPEELNIHLINVQPPLLLDDTRFNVSPEHIVEYQHQESEKATLAARELLDAAAVSYTCHHLVGRPGEEISSLADSLQCDQIVMGTHGRSPFQEFMMGSVTQKVIHFAKIPILLVK